MAVAENDANIQTNKNIASSSSSNDEQSTVRSTSTQIPRAGATRRTTSMPAVDYGDYNDYQVMPSTAWPPPIYVRRSISPQERFYLENRWYSQWTYYDKKATENKNSYYFYQNIVIIGGVIIPTLVSINGTVARALTGAFGLSLETWRTILDAGTVFVSLAVAIAAAILGLQKFGESWASYRSAAEELQSEKSYYDMGAGPYLNNANPLATFVENTENIIAKQNGNYFQTVQKQIEQAVQDNNDYLETYTGQDVFNSQEGVSTLPPT